LAWQDLQREAQVSEFTTLRAAVAELVRDDDIVALEGFTHLIPFAAAHEIMRQKRQRLTLIRMTPDLIYDQMIGMGCAERLIFSWGGNPGVGSLHRFRDAVEHGWPQPLLIEEHSHAGMANRYVAGAANLPFAVLRGYVGTDLPKVTATISRIRCPFSGEELMAVPALRPDVTIIHAQQADRQGNVALWGITGIQKEAVFAARRAIVTVEEVVDEIAPRAAGIVLPSVVVTAIAVVPGGAHPSYAHGYYARDNAFYAEWDAISRDREAFRSWMERHVIGVASFDEYLASIRQVKPGRALRSSAHPQTAEGVGSYTTDEMMTVAAARELRDGAVCFVGIGLPSEAANLARVTHAPNCVLIYESGTIGAKPQVLPLSIGDGELAEHANAVVSVPEVFNYWLQAGRIDVGFLGASQIDRFANINTTVIGPYAAPKVRLPGAGGAPEIAASARQVIVILRHRPQAFVERLDFVTSVGHAEGGDTRLRLGYPGAGPLAVITDLGILRPDPATRELTLTALHPGVSVAAVFAATGWELRIADDLRTNAPPTEAELRHLRELHARTDAARNSAEA
jgi:acyl CoA:acetate/3-ketoacid CoA transferase beta subunit